MLHDLQHECSSFPRKLATRMCANEELLVKDWVRLPILSLTRGQKAEQRNRRGLEALISAVRPLLARSNCCYNDSRDEQ